MTRRLKDLLQTNRYKLLYFIYKAERVRSYPGIKSKLSKAFGYRSDGHFYHDWDYLFKEGLLTEEEGYVKITEKGEEEFKLLSTLKFASITSILLGAMSISIVLNLWQITQVIPLAFLSGIILLTTGVLYIYVIRAFTPNIPDEAKELL